MENDTDQSIDRNRRLLGLALDCRLIYPRKKEKIEAILAERLEKDGQADVLDILLEEQVLTEDKAAYLTDLDAHTATCARDQLLGTLAVANQLASQQQVDQALALQKSTFRKTGENRQLGDILTEQGILTPAACTALLLTQNRIKNEDLLEAMDRLGKTKGEREIINKRFGAIALKKELATMEQVGQALGIQREAEKKGEERRFLGAILQEVAQMTPEDVDAILEEQKFMEIRRLDLLKALYSVKEELKIFKRLNTLFSYKVSADGIEAWATRKKDETPPVPVYELLIWLRKAGVIFGILSDKVLSELAAGGEPGQPVLVARGQEPEPCRDEGARFYFENADTQEETDPPEEDAGSLPAPGPVTQGDLLAQIIPGQEGKPGKSVMGHTVHPARPATLALFAGKGVVKKGNDFLAAAEGFPRVKNGNVLTVDPLDDANAARSLAMDIREDTGDEHLQSDLTLKGNILTGARLQCRSLSLKGDLLGEVGCDGDILVEGSLGKADGPRTEVLCHGSMRVAKSVAHARVLCGGSFLAMNADAAGLRVCAARGLTVRGAVAGPEGPSVLRAGLQPQDPLISLDQTLETRAADLAGFKKEAEIAQLTQTYHSDMEKALYHQMEQEIFHDLVEIIDGPELFQYPELQDKLDYLYSLPDHSSIKGYYMKIPDTQEARKVVARFLPPANRHPLEEILRQVKTKLDPEPEQTGDEPPMPETQKIEIAFQARLEALEQEVEERRQEIDQAQRELAALETAREKLGRTYLKSQDQKDFPVIRVKNKCEKGTVIQGILARRTLEKTVYNVRFKEAVDPATLRAVMVIEN